jgi:hypothetical protein
MNPNTFSMDSATMRELVPQRYLVNGWTDPNGRPFKELSGVWATAAAEQLINGHVATHEVETTLEAFLQVLPYYADRDPLDFTAVAFESLGLVAGVLGQPNNPAMIRWMEPCVLAVKTWPDVKAFLIHLRSISIQSSVLAQNGRHAPL